MQIECLPKCYSLLTSGPTGAGKSWLACALAQYACRRGHSALYLRVPLLSEELRVLHGNGGFTKWLLQVARVDVLLLDDWGMAPLDAMVRNDLLEMIDDRSAGKATIVTSQLPLGLHSNRRSLADAGIQRFECNPRLNHASVCPLRNGGHPAAKEVAAPG
jgi:DNA replication protein DnaC